MLLQPRWRFAMSACSLAFLGLVTVGPLPAAELDVHVPPDTEILVTVNVRQALDSDLFKKNALGPAKDALKDLTEVTDILKDLGFDPFKDLNRVAIASPGGDAPDKGLMVVHGKFDLAKFKTRGEEAARDNGDSLKIHKVGDGVGGQLTVYEVVIPDQDASLFVALANEKTMLVSPGKDYVVDGLKRGKANKKAALKSKAFQALVEKMDAKQTASIAVMGKALKGDALDEAPKVVKDLVGKIDALGGGLTIGDDLKFEVVISAKTAGDAASFKDTADKGLKLGLATLLLLGNERKELEALTEILKTVRVTAKGKLVTVRGRVTEEVIQGALKKDE